MGIAQNTRTFGTEYSHFTRKMTKILTFFKYKELLIILLLFKKTALEVPLVFNIMHLRMQEHLHCTKFSNMMQNI